ncbi:uncharacterized protein NESG_00145 [Nematocida ausubeli]|uniref:Uncharacterized protein n=1 Tax=Nematocida ausubeli (strain ATCC PRA-371 / ERTm2) TaxID=1913371 RepID=A0A086J4K3_NEMA1|nr:uncharacterized protein NESG_00145 [Nematocida ausubeli]KAI5132490.1 hypothetical protein NEAUS06_0185 [Nematocida ausubeli]KAI5135863.1 hypothetical protein NEAUS07_1381 [Nematocida ausubeli]KAI5149105.1 hypothetical protein NEAUS05_1649 [Nematocida ausubeli]KFG27071.1 hypothetical protein NESG_00145 [Nematocida ausubeli]
MCHGCGMSMCIVWDTEVSEYFIPGLCITRKLFPALILFIACTTLAANHINEITKNKYIVDVVRFLGSWILMMTMMTGNGYILCTMLISVIISRIILQKTKKERSFECCQ